jgi:hypothetical protein
MSDTAIAIIGVVAGFITAFFAEPVKIYFQNKARLNTLRLSLYRELWHNYALLNTLLDYLYRFGFEFPDDAESSEARERTLKVDDMIKTKANHYVLDWEGTRTDCYEQAVKNDLYLLYQLSEVSAIRRLYYSVNAPARHSKGEPIDWKDAIPFHKNYSDSFSSYVFTGVLSKKILGKIVPKKEYKELLLKGRQVTERRAKVNFEAYKISEATFRTDAPKQ